MDAPLRKPLQKKIHISACVDNFARGVVVISRHLHNHCVFSTCATFICVVSTCATTASALVHTLCGRCAQQCAARCAPPTQLPIKTWTPLLPGRPFARSAAARVIAPHALFAPRPTRQGGIAALRRWQASRRGHGACGTAKRAEAGTANRDLHSRRHSCGNVSSRLSRLSCFLALSLSCKSS